MRSNLSKGRTKKAGDVFPAGSSSSDQSRNVDEARYRSMIELLPQAVWIADGQGTVIYCNKYWQEFSGLTFAQTQESGWFSVLHPEDRPQALSRWRRAFTAGSSVHAEYRLRRARDGEYRWHLIEGVPLKDTRGDVIQRVGIAVDIHAQKANEIALQEKDEQLRLAIEAARLGTWDYSLDDRKFSSTYRSKAILGFPPDAEITYDSFVAVLHPEDLPVLSDAFIRATRPEGLSEFEIHYRIIRPDGSMRWIAARGKGIFSGAGSQRKAVRLTGTVQDITERKQAEQALRDSEEKFRRAFRLNPDAMTITTFSDGVYLDVNDAFLRITGFTREDVVGRKSLDLGIWIDVEDRLRVMRILMANGHLESMETSFRKKNGELVFVQFSAELIEIGHVQCVLATSQDVTERMRVAEELRRSEEQYRSLIERAPYGICRISAQGRFLLVNPALVRVLGYETPSELLALDLATQVYETPEARDALISSLAQDPSKQPPIEARWKRRDGQTITVRLVGTAIRDDQGRLLHSEVFVEHVAAQ
jgi:PAS domain S-box-containing protein